LEYQFLDFDYYDISQSDLVGLETRFLGENRKELLILVTADDAKDDNAIKQLKAILSAIKYELEQDCAILAIEAEESIPFQKLPLDKTKQIISFGIPAMKMGLQIKEQKYNQLKILSIDLLFADSISAISTDVTKKKQLWNALQSLFLS